MRRLKSKRGSVLVGTVGLAIVGAAIIGGYLTMSMNEYKLSQRTLKLQSTMNLAEAGLELGMNCINTSDWTHWTAVGSNGYFRDITNVTFSDGRVARMRVYVEDYNSVPILAAEGRVIEPNGDVLFKQVRVDMESTGLFANGLTAKDTINFNGNSVSIDAYDSTVGLWNYTLNREDEGSVASLSVDNGALDVGNGDIWGYLATGGGAYDIGNNGSVMGDDTPGGVTEDPNRISYDFAANLPDVSAPALTPDYTTLAAGTIGDPTASWSSAPVVYHIYDFTLSGTNSLDVVGPVVIIVDDDFEFSGSAQLNIIGTDAYLKLYIGDDLKLTGNGVFNQELNPEAFQVWGTGNNPSEQYDIKIAGNGDLAGIVYAPNADVEMVGNGNMSGAAVGENVTLTGNAAFHYDLNLKNFDDNGSMGVKRWRELRGASEWLDFSSTTNLAASISPL